MTGETRVAVGQGVRERSSWERQTDRGMVTAELAAGTLLGALCAVIGAWPVSLVMTWTACQDTAVAVARQEARADHMAAARMAEQAPQGAEVRVARDAGYVTVHVAVVARPWIALLPQVPLKATAVAVLEPGVAG